MRIILTLLLAFLANICFAQNLADKQNTLLWAVINAKGDTSYLFGTFHEFGSSYYKKYPEVWKKFRSCKTLYLEQLLNDQAEFFKRSRTAESTKRSWIEDLSNKDYKTINNYLRKLEYDVPLKKMKGITPFDLKYSIGQDINTKVCGIEDTADEALMEEYLYYLAPGYAISVLGLEKTTDSLVLKTIQFVSQSESEESAIAHIIDIATNENRYMDSVRASGVCKVVDAYRNADVDYYFNKKSASVDSAYLFALDERNRSWMPTIKQSIDRQKTFIAIGMMHLKFENGLINLLLKEGYRVVPQAMK